MLSLLVVGDLVSKSSAVGLPHWGTCVKVQDQKLWLALEVILSWQCAPIHTFWALVPWCLGAWRNGIPRWAVWKEELWCPAKDACSPGGHQWSTEPGHICNLQVTDIHTHESGAQTCHPTGAQDPESVGLEQEPAMRSMRGITHKSPARLWMMDWM